MSQSKEPPSNDGLITALNQLTAAELASALRQVKLLPMAMQLSMAHVETIKEASTIRKVVFKGGWGAKETVGTGWKRTASGQSDSCTVHYNDGKTQTHTGDAGQTVEYNNGQYFFSTEGVMS